MSIAEINRRFSNFGLGLEVRKHNGGLFYIVSLRDGRETILNSAMGLNWVQDWAAERFRRFFQTFVAGGAAYYPATGADPLFFY